MSTNIFPRGVFPKVVEDYIFENSDKQGFCIDFLYSSYLAVISTLIGNRYKIHGIGWSERPLVWVAIVGDSGVKKTPSIMAMVKPLEKYNLHFFNQYTQELTEHKRLKSINENSTAPVAKQILVDDITVEALLKVMEFNPDGLLLIKDELMGLIYDSQRYNKNGQEEKFLSIFSGKQIIVNRKSEDSYSVINDPFLTLLGGIQPRVLSKLLTDDRMNNGFVYRLLFCYPEEAGIKQPKEGFENGYYEEYENFIFRFTKLKSSFEFGENEPTILHMDNQAKNCFNNWLESYIYSDQKSEFKEHFSKMEGYVLRIALIIEFSHSIARQDIPQNITLKSIDGAIEICSYFTNCFFRALNDCKIQALSKTEEILRISIAQYKSGKTDGEVVRYLLNENYKNSEISKALRINKSSVTFHGKR